MPEKQIVGADAQGKKRKRNLSHGADPSVKVAGQIFGKPNAWSSERFPAKACPGRDPGGHQFVSRKRVKTDSGAKARGSLSKR
jgi:hypothetical protein